MKYQIVDSEKGQSVVASEPLQKGELVCVGMPLSVTTQRTNHSFQIEKNLHVELNAPAKLFNHSCEPNMYLRNNRLGGYSFHAVRDIEIGEELVWHYGMTEAESIAVDACLCGSEECSGRSLGFTDAPISIQRKLAQYGIADYLREWYGAQLTLEESEINNVIPLFPEKAPENKIIHVQFRKQ